MELFLRCVEGALSPTMYTLLYAFIHGQSFSSSQPSANIKCRIRDPHPHARFSAQARRDNRCSQDTFVYTSGDCTRRGSCGQPTLGSLQAWAAKKRLPGEVGVVPSIESKTYCLSSSSSSSSDSELSTFIFVAIVVRSLSVSPSSSSVSWRILATSGSPASSANVRAVP